jgi:signal transduction histidine kinase
MKVTVDSAVVHRLKNQLTVIVGFAELLLSEMTEGGRTREDVAEIRQAAREAIALIRDLDPATAVEGR